MPNRVQLSAGIVLAAALALPFASTRAADGARCQETILARGSDLFATEETLTLQCQERMLTNATQSSCPDSVAQPRLDAATTRARDAVTTACNAGRGTLLCFESAADEGVDLVVGVYAGGSSNPTTHAARRCQKVIGRKATRLADLKRRALESCNRKAAGGAVGYGPSGPSCDSPSGRTQAAIVAAGMQARSIILAACAGLDPQDDLGFGSSCPGSPHCEFPIPTLDDLAACAGCIAEKEVDQLSAGLAAIPVTSTEGCTIGRGVAAKNLADDLLRDLAACEDGVLRGHILACPDSETAADVAADVDSYVTSLGEFCGPAGGVSPALIEAMVDALLPAIFPVSAAEPDHDKQTCKRQIGDTVGVSGNIGFGRRKLRLLTTCKLESHCGQVVGACPSASTDAAIARSAAANANAIHHDCDAFTPADLGFAAASCACNGLPLATIADLIACIQCESSNVADTISELTFTP